MIFKKWIVAQVQRELAKQLAYECDIDPFAALVASGRGYTDAAEIEQLISEELIFCDPKELVDIQKAADAINEAIAQNKKIAVFGDYDCDGVTATALMYNYLSSRSADVITYIPDRILEGYGMNKLAVDRLKDAGVELIITVDNGISCYEEIAYANSLGIKTVVTDHHLPPEILPDALAVVDPHRLDCNSSFKEVCGVAVAFKLVCVIEDKEPEEMLERYADLLAVGTIGDVMPLTDENRSIVKAGIKKIRKNARVGIGALIGVAGLEKVSINAGKVAFGIVPRINAAGRMGSAKRALELLLSDNMLEALKIANEVDAQNSDRQSVERQIFEEAVLQVESYGYKYNRVIVVSGENWNLGVVGIVASRLTERYGKPTFVIGIDGNEAHGSGRSIEGFSLYDAMLGCADTLTKFGGHTLAGGISLTADKIDEFRNRINDYASELDCVVPKLHLDCRINPSGMSVELADAVKLLEPFGNGNPAPVFGIFEAVLKNITPIGSGKHLRLLFTKGNNTFQALLFGVTPAQFCFKEGDTLDLAVALESNLYKGNYSLSVQIKALRLSGIDEEYAIREINLYHSYKSGKTTQKSSLLPTRAEVGEIYKQIIGSPVLRDRIGYLALKNKEIGYAKTEIAIDVLTELGLISEEKGVLVAVKGAAKTDLMNSKIYKELCEGGNNCE